MTPHTLRPGERYCVNGKPFIVVGYRVTSTAAAQLAKAAAGVYTRMGGRYIVLKPAPTYSLMDLPGGAS